ncbi:PLAC8 [Branchiostoma lanceolatum]|uniref:PLAC8 protein n=1 Tax=Branchiostoma lanceolatum TaxID=7740 RepID=A0A8J9VBK5_BRALA|nr:PLAC8 [Branchiostoma lanceolatum]
MMGQHPLDLARTPLDLARTPLDLASTPLDLSSTPLDLVITQQPGGYVATVSPQKRDWSSGLGACSKDPASCLCSFCFPSFYTCCILPRMNENCCLGFFGPTALALMRAKMRAEHGIQGDLCNDACISWFCCPCVLAQLSREIDYVNGQPAMVRQ